MSAYGGIPAQGGTVPAPAGGRRKLPPVLGAVSVLAHVLLGATVLGGLGLLGSGLAADATDAAFLGLVLYGAAPGVAGWLLARRIRTGGPRVWLGLVAVQVWLIVSGLSNVLQGSAHGVTQLFLPVVLLAFLTRPESRGWFRLPGREREVRPRAGFSLAHMITWRRDRGQTSVEYVGMIVVVVAVIAALVLSVGNLGGTVSHKIQEAICSVTGTSCASGDGDQSQADGDPDGGAANGGATEGADGGAAGGTDGTGGDDGGTAGTGRPSGGQDGKSSGGQDGGSSGGKDGGSSGGQGGGEESAGGRNGGPEGTEPQEAPGTPEHGPDTYPETSDEPEAAYDVPATDKKEDPAGQGGEGGDEEDCGGWGFFGCAWDRVSQVGKGLFVDGVWGDVTGFVDLFKGETWSGMAEYGKQLGNQWTQDSEDAGSKWDKGDYLGALGDWGKASFNTVVKVGDDMFVGDDVRDRWNNGEKTRAVTDVVWNVGSLFIPGYDVAKVIGKTSRLGKLGKIAAELAEAADKAGDAARRARKAAEAGDVDGARKAAKEADEAADAAEENARRTGCTIALAPGPRSGFAGAAGSGTTVLAAGPPRTVVLADGGCDEDAKAKAEEARQQERAAYLAKKRAEEPERARQALEKKKPYPEPERNDTSDPRNYDRTEWEKDLDDPTLGSADSGDGYWAGRDRNPKPNWANESWLRYQEQITGTKRGKEYVVPHPDEGVPDVEYDGWDSGRQTFLEAKNGYDSFLSETEPGTLTKSGRSKFVAEAKRQVEASGGRSVEWHFSNPDVARAARKAFRVEGLPIRVVHTAQKPVDYPRKPGAFD